MAKKTVKEVVTKWGFQVDKKPLEDMKKSVAGVKANLMALGGSALASATAIFGLAEHTADAANEMRFAALRAGVSAKSFQEMSFAAKMSGVDSEAFGHSLQFLNRNMFAARTGSKEAGRAFFELGGGVAQAVEHGASNVTVFKMIADRMKSIKDPARAGALAMQIFGRAGQQLMPLLKQGSKGIEEFSEKAEKMGIVFSDETLKDAEEFHETMAEVTGNLVGFKNTIGSALIGPVTDILKIMTKWMDANREFINSQVKDFVAGLRANLAVTATIFGKLLQIVSALVRPFGGLGSTLKYILTAFTAIKALNLMVSLGQMAQAVWGLRAAWQGLAASEIAADLAAIAIPAAIGAAVVLIGLAIEDLWGFFHGKNSVFGKIIEMFKTHFPNAVKYFSDPIDLVIQRFHELYDVVQKVSGFIAKVWQPIGAALGKANSYAINTLDSAGLYPKGLPSSPTTATLGTLANQNSSSATLQAPINITVGPGTDPSAVGDSVIDHIQRQWDSMLRGAQRAHTPPGVI